MIEIFRVCGRELCEAFLVCCSLSSLNRKGGREDGKTFCDQGYAGSCRLGDGEFAVLQFVVSEKDTYAPKQKTGHESGVSGPDIQPPPGKEQDQGNNKICHGGKLRRNFDDMIKRRIDHQIPQSIFGN